MEKEKELELKRVSAQIRYGIIDGVYCARSGHPGGSLSIVELLTYLYFVEMRIDSKNPKWIQRDRLVLSKGHAAPALYAALAYKKFFSYEEIRCLRHNGAMLQGHPDMKKTPGIDMTTGSLGQGISAACGIALAGKLQNRNYRVYTIVGDGETEEGQVWEAAMFAAHKKLDNLCMFVDCNGLQIDGLVSEIGGPEPLDEKFKAFGFHVITIDAHDFVEIESAVSESKRIKGAPTAVIARSSKGKGISFMENRKEWHGKAPNREEYEQAMQEIKIYMSKLEKERCKSE
ncbi:transketolase [Anaerosinus massiliensis]|uniref:transketolase n=1 Tax=Massilibacillus massiliensis TaxID=1806837 RepID=UPI000ADA5FCB|nr:transketolase [Massilibacillus massiliensis]